MRLRLAVLALCGLAMLILAPSATSVNSTLGNVSNTHADGSAPPPPPFPIPPKAWADGSAPPPPPFPIPPKARVT
jgi:hypothetical protein